MADVQAFVAAIWERWFLLVSGGVVVTIIAVVEKLRRREVHRGLYIAALIGVLLWAAFLAWRDEHKQRVALYEQLHPAVQVYMRWPESWFWNGKRYPSTARIKLDDSAQLEMTTRAYQRMDPMIFAPPTQRLTDVRLFLTFSRAVTPIDYDPTRQPLAIWTTNENNSFYSTIGGAINPGSGANVAEAFCFTVAEAGPLGVRYAFSPAETAPIGGRFNITVKDATP